MASPAIERPPPSTWAIAFATAIISGLAGYFLGQASSIGVFAKNPSDSAAARVEKDGHDQGPHESEEAGDEEDEDDQEIKSFADHNEECKLVLVVRTDLGMTKGKIAAQCGHATLACYKTLLEQSAGKAILKKWEGYGQAKVAVQVKSEEELEILQAQAVSLGVCAKIIHDAGRTQIASGSATVLGVGPAPKSVINQVTGHLKLL
ncbi:hypothetical protein MBLNU457_3087t1 [Dothideomycetes sp. NU457]